MPPEQQICYLHVTFKDSPEGNLVKIAYRTNAGIVNMVNTLTMQYAQHGVVPSIAILSEAEGDKMVKAAVLTYPLWQDLVEAGQLQPLIFAN